MNKHNVCISPSGDEICTNVDGKDTGRHSFFYTLNLHKIVSLTQRDPHIALHEHNILYTAEVLHII